jgi:hypothetical protein
VVFTESQNPGADLSTTNQVTLQYDPTFQSYSFSTPQTAGAQSGTLYIHQEKTIPPQPEDGTVTVAGIGMSGVGTFVKQVEPNMLLEFTPHPEYWITFGNYTQGEVMDITEISSTAQINFAPNVYSMKAILNEDNTWTIGDGAQTVGAFSRARGSKPLRNGNKLLSNGNK